MDCKVLGVAKSRTHLSNLHFHFLYSNRYTLFNLFSVNGHLDCFQFVCFLYSFKQCCHEFSFTHNLDSSVKLLSQRICISDFDT